MDPMKNYSASDVPPPSSVPGTFGALIERLGSLIDKAHRIGTEASSVRGSIVGSSPEKVLQTAPKAVPNGHIEALDEMMSELSAELDFISDSVNSVLCKI